MALQLPVRVEEPSETDRIVSAIRSLESTIADLTLAVSQIATALDGSKHKRKR